MVIKESEQARQLEIEQLKERVAQMTDSEAELRNTVQDLETQICDKNKVIIIITNSSYLMSPLKGTAPFLISRNQGYVGKMSNGILASRFFSIYWIFYLGPWEFSTR